MLLNELFDDYAIDTEDLLKVLDVEEHKLFTKSKDADEYIAELQEMIRGA